MDRIAIHTIDAFEAKRDYVVKDTRASIERGWSATESIMRNPGLIAETFLYVMGKHETSLTACTYLVMDKRPPKGFPIPSQLALVMGRIGQALRAGGKAIDDGKTQDEIDGIAKEKLFDSYDEEVFVLIKHYLHSISSTTR